MADDEIDQTGTDPHRGFGATNVPMPVDAAFAGFASAAPADGDQPDDAVEAPEAVPGTRAVRKTRRSADAPPAPEPDEWVVVLETQDEQELARISEDLEHGGVRAELQIESGVSLMRGMERTYELIVPATEAELALALIEDGHAAREALESWEVGEEPGDELFLLRDRIDAEMPGATRRQKEREYRRRRKALRPEYGSGRQTPISVLLLLIVGVIVFVLVLSAIVG